MYQLGDLVRSVPFFKDAEVDFLEELAIHLHFEVYLKGETIMKIGKRGNKMYFIDRGIVEVVTEAGEVTATLDKGSHFGGVRLIASYLHVCICGPIVYLIFTHLCALHACMLASRR